MKNTVLFLALLCAALPAGARAQTLPDMKSQAAWKDKDKQDFLKFLKSGQPAPVNGQVKAVSAGGSRSWHPGKARYLTLELASDSLVTVNSAGKAHTGAPAFTPGLMAGGHLFSWIRYYAGLRYSRPRQDKRNGDGVTLTHYELPAGIEMALIPLGTPQTRYVLLRAGLSEHYFTAGENKAAFNPSLLGWHAAWNLGLGYEWQLPETRWRLHVLAEGCRSFASHDAPEFYRLGLTAGAAYTF